MKLAFSGIPKTGFLATRPKYEDNIHCVRFVYFICVTIFLHYASE